jgi:hypothetical protein
MGHLCTNTRGFGSTLAGVRWEDQGWPENPEMPEIDFHERIISIPPRVAAAPAPAMALTPTYEEPYQEQPLRGL